MVSAIEPGVGIDLGPGAVPERVATRPSVGFQDILLSFFSDNIVKAMAETDILPVIVFSLVSTGFSTASER